MSDGGEKFKKIKFIYQLTVKMNMAVRKYKWVGHVEDSKQLQRLKL